MKTKLCDLCRNTGFLRYCFLWKIGMCQIERENYEKEIKEMNNKKKPIECPFCGEIPQINCKNPNECMHACRVLDKSIYADILAWNTRYKKEG